MAELTLPTTTRTSSQHSPCTSSRTACVFGDYDRGQVSIGSGRTFPY